MRQRILSFTTVVVFIFMGLVSEAQWPATSMYTKPWTRWWLMGSAMDQQNINRQLSIFQESGLGGVELVPIYGAKNYEDKYISYLSKPWVAFLDHTTRKADSLKMGVYLSMGSGWPIGGPQVNINDAASKLVIEKYAISADDLSPLKIQAKGKDQAYAKLLSLMAYGEKGELLDITSQVGSDGSLLWKPQSGKWQLYAGFNSKTLQKVKRAAPGGDGYTLDHFSETAFKNYLKTWDAVLGSNGHGVKAFYNDSYEVFGADWTDVFLKEFKARRGYDLQLYLKEFASNEKTDLVARLKTDYRETMSDLMLQNFSKNFTDFSHSKKTKSLNQAHGSPGNLLDLYAAVDIPETETFGSSYFPIPGLRRDSADIRNVDPDPMMLKFASSAAHVMGKPYTSSETFTWLTEHFKTSWAQCKPELDQVFLSGINHVFYHGTTYSPKEAAWPGWLFYASVEFNPTNSLWPHLKGLNDYINRCQSVLQAGQPDNDVLAYWPVFDAWKEPKGMDMPLKVHDVDVWLHPTAFYKNLHKMQDVGYSFDFVSDRMLDSGFVNNGQLKINKAGASYKVLLVSSAELMPVASVENLIRLAKSGANIVWQSFPKDVPGLFELEKRRAQLNSLINSLQPKQLSNGMQLISLGKGNILIAEDIVKALAYFAVQRETMTDDGLKFIRRKLPSDEFYFITNLTAKSVDKTISLATHAKQLVLLNPLTGAAGKTSFVNENSTINFRLALLPGESIIVKASETPDTKLNNWVYRNAAIPMQLNGVWNLHFKEGGPVLPSDKTVSSLKSWTSISEDSTLQNFSGLGIYSTTFNLPVKNAEDYILSLTEVNESAKITINGKEAGIIWSLPYQLNIGKYLKQGANTISIEVANLMANRIRYMDQHQIVWRKFHEINFANINYKPFDASNWKVQKSGLEGPVQIIPINSKNAEPLKKDWTKKVGARVSPKVAKIYWVNDAIKSADTLQVVTKAIQNTIDLCSKNGGGIVAFKPGVYLTGSIFLKSNVHLKIDQQVLIKGSQDFNDYPEIDTRIAGIEMKWPAALINVISQQNVKISGQGKVNAQGKFCWDKYWQMRKEYEPKGLRWIVDYDAKRVRTLLVQSSSDVTVNGLRFSNAGFWTVQLLYSNHITVDGIVIRNNEDGKGPSTDGIDIDSSSWVLVENCDIDCNDDDFCLKAGRDWDGLRVNRPTEYVVIRNSIARKGGGLLTLGSETSGGIRHVLATGLVAKGTGNGFHIKSATTRGGLIEDIHFVNNTMDSVGNAFMFTMNWNPAYSYSKLPEAYLNKPIPKHWETMLHKVEPFEKGIPKFKDIYVQDINVKQAKKAMNASGLQESSLEGFHFDNISINTLSAGDINFALDWTIRQMKLQSADKSTIQVNNSKNINIF